MSGGRGVRGRMLTTVLLVGLVLGSGWWLEGSVGPRPRPAGSIPADVTGAWFCPHGGGERWRTWIVVANPSDRDATVRAVTYGRGAPSVQRAEVPPGVQAYLEVPADGMASGSAIEYFGAPVAAGMVSARDRGQGVAAEPCSGSAATSWSLPEGTTERGFDQRLVIMNPFAQRAVVDVTLVTEGERIRTGDLTGVVLEPATTTALNLGEFALGERTLGASVRADLGRVVVASMGVSEDGLRTSLGAPAPSRTWVLPGAGERGGTAVTVLAGGDDAPFRVRTQDDEEQVEVVGEADVAAGAVDTLDLDAERRTLLVVADGAAPFVAARRLVRGDDEASTAGAPEGGTRWVALPAGPPEGGAALLVVENPGEEVAEAHLSLLTSDGRAEAPSLERLVLLPGRSRTFSLGDLVGEEPVSVLVETSQGVVVVAQSAYGEGGYAVSTGVRFNPLG